MEHGDDEVARQVLVPDAQTPSSIVTLGYVGLSLDRISEILHEVGVFHVVDIRARPTAAWPHMDEKELEVAFGAVRMTYESRPELGTPDEGDHDRRQQAFRQQRLGEEVFMAAVREFVDRAWKGQRFALMCNEGEYRRCHRWHYADALAARGVPVVHLSGHQAWNAEDRERAWGPSG